MLVLGVALLATAAFGRPARSAKDGGTFRIEFSTIDAIDPAVNYFLWNLASTTCAQLLTYADKPLPAGLRIVPEASAGYPRVSRDGKTYTFRIRKNFRFNTGARLTAANFARSIDRLANPQMQSFGTQYIQDVVVGAKEVMDGKHTHVSGVVARGRTLILHLTRPAPDFPSRMVLPYFCPVPVNLPINPEGVGVPLPGAGPYYYSKFVPNRLIVIKRNRFYHGNRPHHVAQFTVQVAADPIADIERGKADYGDAPGPEQLDDLARRYGVNKKQFFLIGGTAVRLIMLNTVRPLFRNNAPLRRAVNFAIDRPALLAARGGRYAGKVTDHYLPPDMAGVRHMHFYPLKGPNVRKAKALARGHLRGGKAILWTCDRDFCTTQAQVVKQNLARIGIDVTVQQFPNPVIFQSASQPGAAFDITFLGYGPDFLDPAVTFEQLLDGRRIKDNAALCTPCNFDWSYFNSKPVNRSIDRASRLSGQARYRAFGELEARVVRNYAPMVAYANESATTLLSKRVGCHIFNPFLDLAAVCLT